MLSADQLGQVAAFLVVVAVPEYLVDAEIGVGAVAEAHAGRAPGDLFHGNGVGQVAKSGPAVLLGDRDAQEAQLAQPGPKVPGKLVGLVDVLGARGDLLGGEPPHRVPNEVDGLAQGVVQAAVSGPSGCHFVIPLETGS